MSDENSEILEYIAKHSVSGSYHFNSENMAKKIMLELVKSGYADFLLLRDDEVSKWWGSIVSKASQAIADKKEKLRLYEIKMAAWERLSADERKILKLRKPSKPRG